LLIRFLWTSEAIGVHLFITSVARFFLAQSTKTGKNLPNERKIYIPNGHEALKIVVKYSKWPQNIPTNIPK
jgi:hypothetical protein